ncbi:MAG: hypothetical protein AB8B56_17525 [Crocinitomicaceae bacterium]
MVQNPEEQTSFDYRVWLYALFGLIALLILSDFLIPGTIYNQEIHSIQKEHQQYFNAGGNSHVSFKVTTDEHEFSVSEEFADTTEEGTMIEYAVSGIFRETNWYQLHSKRSEIHSLRIFTGLIIPLIVLVAMGLSYFLKRKMETLVFVLQLLLVLDMIYLIM